MPSVRFPIDRLIIATHNAGKLREFQALLRGIATTVTSAGALGLPEPIEDGASFRANALLKARAAVDATGSTALADDSGLCVTALAGEPGIHSARWALAATGDKDFVAAMRRIHDRLGNNPDRSACFSCALALIDPAGTVIEVEGRLDGTLVWPPRGAGGHGYDPFFVPAGAQRTLAELSETEKNAVSHRGRALRQLADRLRGKLSTGAKSSRRRPISDQILRFTKTGKTV